MELIKAVLFEPVGCLAEFPPEPFLKMAADVSGRKMQASKSGSRAYWHLLNLLESAGYNKTTESLELQAVDNANIYEDVLPALSELEAMGVKLFIASSLSGSAIARFLERCPHKFDAIWNRDNAAGLKALPLAHALSTARLPPEHAMFLTDTAEGIKVARSVSVHPILMMNDPDESKRLTAQNPAGGVVSLHELPDFIRFVRAAHLPA
jgi:FMN phosphatase YigB (HAD superfamily)